MGYNEGKTRASSTSIVTGQLVFGTCVQHWPLCIIDLSTKVSDYSATLFVFVWFSVLPPAHAYNGVLLNEWQCFGIFAGGTKKSTRRAEIKASNHTLAPTTTKLFLEIAE